MVGKKHNIFVLFKSSSIAAFLVSNTLPECLEYPCSKDLKIIECLFDLWWGGWFYWSKPPFIYLSCLRIPFPKISSKHLHFHTIRDRKLTYGEEVHLLPPVTCHLSHVMCHLSHVMCHVSLLFLFLLLTKWLSLSLESLVSTCPPRVFFK